MKLTLFSNKSHFCVLKVSGGSWLTHLSQAVFVTFTSFVGFFCKQIYLFSSYSHPSVCSSREYKRIRESLKAQRIATGKSWLGLERQQGPPSSRGSAPTVEHPQVQVLLWFGFVSKTWSHTVASAAPCGQLLPKGYSAQGLSCQNLIIPGPWAAGDCSEKHTGAKPDAILSLQFQLCHVLKSVSSLSLMNPVQQSVQTGRTHVCSFLLNRTKPSAFELMEAPAFPNSHRSLEDR